VLEWTAAADADAAVAVDGVPRPDDAVRGGGLVEATLSF
jgi:hypothetical protein